MLLDNRTLLFSLTLISSLMALSLAFVSQARTRDGLRLWAGAMLLESSVWVLAGARGIIADFYSITVANVLMTGVLSLKLAAICAYRQLPWPRWSCLLPIAVSFAVFSALPYEDLKHRLIYNSALFSAQILMIVQVLRGDTESRQGRAWWLLYCSSIAVLPPLALRAAVAASGIYAFSAPHTSIAPNPVQLAVFVCIVALDLLGTMGFILMIKERADREIRELAMTDSLTGIFNRRAFMAQAEKEIAVSQRTGLPLGMLMLDIDHFKRINDEYGHATGDAVLVGITNLLTSQLRRQDTLGRYGGEEFCALLPATDTDGAFALAEKLRRTVESIPLSIGDAVVPVTISIGVTMCHASDCGTCRIDYNQLLAEADKALYQAKREGRNRSVMLPQICPYAPPCEVRQRTATAS